MALKMGKGRTRISYAPNNKFKSDSQRLAPSFQVSLVFMAQWFK